MKIYFEALDSTRTLLAILVAIGHFFSWDESSLIYPRGFFLAVDFFFVLSGFVLTQSIFVDTSLAFKSFVYSFMRRRALRLFPLYLIGLLLCILVIVFHSPQDLTCWSCLVSAAFLLQGFDFYDTNHSLFLHTSVGISWSISVELWAGLVYFPFLYILKSRPAFLVTFSTLLALGCVYILAQISTNGLGVIYQTYWGVVPLGFIRGLFGFSIGTFTYLTYLATRSIPISKFTVTICEIFVGLLIAFFLIGFFYDRRYEYSFPLAFGLFIILLALKKGWVAHFFMCPTTAELRALSYSIYLVHPFYIYLWHILALPFNYKLLGYYVCLTLLTAHLIHHTIEKPVLIWGRSFQARRKMVCPH